MLSRRCLNVFYSSRMNRFKTLKLFTSAKINICPLCTVSEKKVKEETPKISSFAKIAEEMMKEKPVKGAEPEPPIETRSLVKGLFLDRIDDVSFT